MIYLQYTVSVSRSLVQPRIDYTYAKWYVSKQVYLLSKLSMSSVR